MVDINKYLETQFALAEQKSKLTPKVSPISQKSKCVAERITKKQDKLLVKNRCKRSKEENASPEPQQSSSTSKVLDDDSDYLPSCDEEESMTKVILPCSVRSKQLTNKVIDDGDMSLYNERIENWRKDLAKAKSGIVKGISISADVQYVLDGNQDVDETHELQNGLCIPNFIWNKLYKYQRVGVKWLWELHQVQSGGLLGDEMGLGKTVQIIAFLAGLSKTDIGSWGGLGPSIIVAPATVIYQWVTHFQYWCPHLRVAVLHHSGSHSGNHNKLIRELHSSHGILMVTYAGIVRYHKDIAVKKWHYLILDEGHKIRNPETQVSKLVKTIHTPHKILITGSPMQNSLQELWSLFDFMRHGLLGTHAAFMEHFAAPITQGGYANATEMQEATALEIAVALKRIITPYMLRRTKTEVQDHIKLPEKNEQVLFCGLGQEQRDLYMGYLMSGTVRSILDKESRYGDPLRARVLVALSTLRKICNHPDLYLHEAQDEQEPINEEIFGNWKRSGKMTVVHSLLKIWMKQGHRCLLFSQSRAMLCLLEQYLLNHNYKYLKMDGTVSVSLRQNLIKTFNDNSEYLVFLATTRVGGLGVNLTGADRVIIYDPDWNPATDSQAKERAWRIGQQRNVTVYRLLSAGTIEEKIYQRQIFKHFLSNKILIDPNQKNVLTTSTLQGLFTFEEPNCDGDTETASLFKHTKVDIDYKKDKNCHTASKINAQQKLDAMRRKAKEISKKISIQVIKSKGTEIHASESEDPREKYKKKRDILLNPPIEEKLDINLVDDKITNIAFEGVISEIDIINLHVKKNYEEKLLKDVVKTQKDDVLGEQNIKENNVLSTNDESSNKDSDLEENKMIYTVVNNLNSKDIIKKTHVKRKRERSASFEIENLVAIKKVKKKHKQNKKNKDSKNDDDYVLNKLFAKATVKNALQHDIVVGLAEKEKKHRMKEEATRKARQAVKAIRFSYNR